jgi:hypothetical protein
MCLLLKMPPTVGGTEVEEGAAHRSSKRQTCSTAAPAVRQTTQLPAQVLLCKGMADDTLLQHTTASKLT